MKFLFAFLLGTFSLLGFSQELAITTIRKNLEQAVTSETVANQLVEQLTAQTKNDATRTALLAQAQGILCLHTKNPAKLVKYTKLAINYANEAVRLDAKNIEARFARFAIESEIPKFMGKSQHSAEDKAFLAQSFTKTNTKHIPYEVLEGMVEVLTESGKFSSAEISTIKKVLQ